MANASTPTGPRCAHCGHDGTYDRKTGKGGALYLTVDCMWKADVGKWELMERDDESGRSFDCLKCDARTEVNGAEEACFPYGALIAPADYPAPAEGPKPFTVVWRPAWGDTFRGDHVLAADGEVETVMAAAFDVVRAEMGEQGSTAADIEDTIAAGETYDLCAILEGHARFIF